MRDAFFLPNGVDMEKTELQSDIELQLGKRQQLLGLVSREKCIFSPPSQVKAFLGSTYIYKMVFSQMKTVKGNQLT